VLVSEFTSAEVPSLGKLDAGYFDRIERLTKTIALWAAERGLRFADVRGVLGRSGRPHAELLRDFCHPTPAGHLLIADELARVGEEAGWPTRRRRER
jgi:lysophospholipase L1-like esterase